MSETVANPPGPAPRSLARGWYWALIVSLGLNFLVIGAVGGAALRGRFMGPPPPNGGNVGAYLTTLPPDRQASLRPIQGKAHKMLEGLRHEVRAARIAEASAILADTFDKPAFLAADKATLEAEQRLRAAATDVLADTLTGMTKEERRRFVTWRARHQPFRSPDAEALKADAGGAAGKDGPK